MKKKVLLVEDEASLNDAFSILLTKEGFEVVSAFNGKQALDKLKSFEPNVILLDLLMPVMDGKTFLKKFKNLKNVPIMVFSNLDAKDEIEEVLNLGATKYMLKAWANPKELVRIIQSLA